MASIVMGKENGHGVGSDEGLQAESRKYISGLYKEQAIFLSPPSPTGNAQVVELVDTHA